jgi:hypothetical protein
MKIYELLYDCEECIMEDETIEERSVERQFRRYGNNLKRQYRCLSGPKKGLMVTQPLKCGIRKNPKRVIIGKKAARSKMGQRIRHTQFTKRKTAHKQLVRLNKVLRNEE